MGATMTGRKAPPKFATSEWAWSYTLNKLAEKGNLDEYGNPTNYAAACAIYKRVVAKYGPGDEPEVEEVETIEADRATILGLASPVWVVGRGCAWAADDETNRRLYLQRVMRKSRSVGAGGVVTDPLYFWRCEITGGQAKSGIEYETRTISVTVQTALFITEQDAEAQTWVVRATEEAIEQLRAAEAGLLDGQDGMGGDAGQFLDVNESIERVQRKIDEFEEALAQ